jgi:hypothetical protein
MQVVDETLEKYNSVAETETSGGIWALCIVMIQHNPVLC